MTFHAAQAHRDDLLRAATADRFVDELPEHVRRGRIARMIARMPVLRRRPAPAATTAKVSVSA